MPVFSMGEISRSLKAAAAVSAAAVMVTPCLADPPVTATVRLHNPSAFSRDGELIRIVNPPFHDGAGSRMWVVEGNCHRPAQWLTNSEGGSGRTLLFSVDIGANEHKLVRLTDDAAGTRQCDGFYPARATLVERALSGLRESVTATVVPLRHQPGSGIYGFEGIGWESERIGYRLYLDHRNAIDVFGKRQPDPVLAQLALSGAGYHAMADWGMDILKVGDSLGVGAIGGFVKGQIVRFERFEKHQARVADDGPVLAAAEVSFTGWQVGAMTTDIQSRYEISARSPLTHARVRTSNPNITLATGVPRNAAATALSPAKARKWQYVASCGPQSLVPDDLGLAVLFRARDRVDEIQDEHSNAVALRPDSAGELSYYFLASWAQEKTWMGSCRSFHEHLERIAERLSDPVVVTVPGD